MYSQETKNILQKILCCPQCRQSLEFREGEMRCLRGHFYQIIDGIMIFRQVDLASDVSLSLRSWDKTHQKFVDNIGLTEGEKNSPYVKSYQRYTEKFFNFQPGSLFLDIGCGIAYNSFFVAQKGITTVNVDISLNALKGSQEYFSKNGREGLFICADILNLPFRHDSFDFIFSSMSLEYFENTEEAVENISKLIKKDGRMFAVVPVFSFSTIYYQLSGNIIDVPVIKPFLKFIHIKLLRGRFLKHGYDKTLRVSFLRKIFNKCFREVELGFFEVDYELAFLKNKFLERNIRKILKHRLFWPLVYIFAKK